MGSRGVGILVVTAAAAALAVLFFGAGYPTPIYDGWGYYVLTGALRGGDLSIWPTGIRSYGYPLFALAATGFRPVPPAEFRLLVFLAQLVLYLVVCGLVARRLGRIFDSPRLGFAAYALGALNPAPLLQATEPLSDLISAVLILAAVALSWRRPGEASARRLASAEALTSFLCAGAAAAVRPANLAIVAGLAAAWAIRAWRWREGGLRMLLAAATGLAAPLVPQALLRRAQTGALLPLFEPGLYREQATWGMRAIKYGTLVMDTRPPFLLYVNPLYGGAATPAEFALRDPLGYAGTLLLHAFAMLDRDLPFTYVTDLRPWYGTPVAAANFVVLLLALAGLATAAARIAARRRHAGVRAEHREGRTPQRSIARRRSLDERSFVAVATALAGGAYLAVYLPVAVEARFGLPLQALAPAPIVCLLAALRDRERARSRTALLAGTVAALWGSVALSAWIARHRTNPADLRSQLEPAGVSRSEGRAPERGPSGPPRSPASR